MSKVLVIGSINTDLVVHASRIPNPGETILGGEFVMQIGGKGANQAVAAKRLGGDVAFICKTGEDVFGHNMRTLLYEEGLTTSWVLQTKEYASGTAMIVVDDKGENTIVVAQGANAYLTRSDIENLNDVFTSSEIILMQMEIPEETINYCIHKAFELNKRVVLNPAPARSLHPDILRKIFCITPNESETELLTGITIRDEESMHRAAEFLLNAGVQWSIITLGKNGCFVAGKDLRVLIPAPQVIPVDTTAAGDVFNGAFVVALTKGMCVKDAASFAVKAASVSVTRSGALTSAPYLEELVF